MSRHRRDPDAEGTRDVVVGIDFGTARSGFCYSLQLDTCWTAPKVVSTYNGHSEPNQCKTRTVLLYSVWQGKWHPTQPGWGFPAYQRYCDEQQHNQAAGAQLRLLEEFKLWLQSEEAKAQANCPLTAQEVISTFLRYLHADMLQHLQPVLGTVCEDRITYCMTIPAGWHHKDRVLMRRAACDAGLVEDPSSERLHILLEPEAAALCASFDNKFAELSSGDHILVVDAGGGTTDIIVYEIAEDRDRRRSLQQMRQPYMLLMGSKLLDRVLERIVSATLGNAVYDDFLSSNRGEFLSTTMASWEDRKHSFRGAVPGTPPVQISLPYSLLSTMPSVGQRLVGLPEPQRGYSDRIVLPANTIKGIFDKVVNPICQAVMSQAQGLNLKRIFLAGGLGSSPYLHERLREVAAELPTQPVVHKSYDQPHAAIVLGAVRHCLNPNHVASRICQKTYGVSVYADPQDGKDSKSRDQAKLQVFDSLVSMGQTVQVGKVVSRTYTVDRLNKDRTLYIFATEKVYGQGERPLITDPEAKMEPVGSVPLKQQKSAYRKMLQLVGSGCDKVTVDFYFGGSEIRFAVTYRGQPQPTPTPLKYDADDVGAPPVMFDGN